MHITSQLHNPTAKGICAHLWHHTDFNQGVHLRGLRGEMRNLPGQPGAGMVQELYTSLPAESWSKDQQSTRDAAASGHKGVRMAILPIPCTKQASQGVWRQWGALPAPGLFR